jgi:hypothetical protein
MEDQLQGFTSGTQQRFEGLQKFHCRMLQGRYESKGFLVPPELRYGFCPGTSSYEVYMYV